MRRTIVFCLIGAAVVFAAKLAAEHTGGEEPDQGSGSNSFRFDDQTGIFTTLVEGPPLQSTNAFFQSLGTNGRTCGTCHVASDGWTIVPAHIQQRFSQSIGQDPLFRTNDGSNCAGADASTPDKAVVAYSLLLSKGLIRVQLPIPANAEYIVVSVDDPNHCAPIPGQISVYRRPLPATNLKFLSSVMWDGRETLPGQSMLANLVQQAIDATTGHAQAPTSPDIATANEIVALEMGTFTAQTQSQGVGPVDQLGGLGGPGFLSTQPFFIGINDPAQSQFNPQVFTLFEQFGANTGSPDKASIRRGEAIFNTRAFTTPSGRTGTCSGCHNAPNSGNHSVSASLTIGVGDAVHRTPDLPLYTFYCPATQQTIQTSDPGRALISGKCADIGKFKVPSLRALSARTPYFHDGSAASLNDVVEFYDRHFNIGLSVQEKADLVAFLSNL
jgi:hypothetical protein